MASGKLDVIGISRPGVSLSAGLVEPTETDGDTFQNNGRTFLYVENGSVGDITVTVDCPHVVDGLGLSELVITVKKTGDVDGKDKMLIGPFTAIFNQSNGEVLVKCSAVADILIGAFQLNAP